MTFQEATEFLGIKDFEQRIFMSNSHGELFHLQEYIALAEMHREKAMDPSWFRPWFVAVVDHAEMAWKRPESVFQHLGKLIEDFASTRKESP